MDSGVVDGCSVDAGAVVGWREELDDDGHLRPVAVEFATGMSYPLGSFDYKEKIGYLILGYTTAATGSVAFENAVDHARKRLTFVTAKWRGTDEASP